MIVPTTILSLAALSAAESSSKRGLRKSSTPPWTAIAVISGTAVVGLGAGFGIGYLILGSSGTAAGGSSGGSCPVGIATCEGCKEDYRKSSAAGADWTCEACPTGQYILETFKKSAVVEKCTGCKAGYYANAENSCKECPGGKNKAKDSFAATYTEILPTACNMGCRENYRRTSAAGEADWTCEVCPTGQYLAASNDNTGPPVEECTGCDVNFYQSGDKACTPCEGETKKASQTVWVAPFDTAVLKTAAKALCLVTA